MDKICIVVIDEFDHRILDRLEEGAQVRLDLTQTGSSAMGKMSLEFSLKSDYSKLNAIDIFENGCKKVPV